MKIESKSLIICTCLGTGYFPKMPGTAGTVLSLIFYLLLPSVIFGSILTNLLLGIIILIISVLLIPIINRCEEILGHDDGRIVIDEFLGYLIAVLFLPKSIITAILSFVFFRVFDILKPEPVNMLQKLPKGAGVMADDLMAGIYANLCVQIIIRIILK